jgi:hypothetical protein
MRRSLDRRPTRCAADREDHRADFQPARPIGGCNEQEAPCHFLLRLAASPVYRAGILRASLLAFPSDELARMDVRDATESHIETVVGLRAEY